MKFFNIFLLFYMMERKTHSSALPWVGSSRGLFCEPVAVKITSFRARIKPYLSFTRKSEIADFLSKDDYYMYSDTNYHYFTLQLLALSTKFCR